MIIKPATSEDIVKIADLYIKNHNEAYRGLLPEAYFERLTPSYAEEKWQGYLNNTENRIWVAYEGEVFLGFTAGMRDSDLPDTWYLDSLHINENARGKGTGTALIRTMGRYASEKGFSSMSVCIVRGNERAGGLYRKLGAEHFSYFEDDFCGAVSQSEKLLWRIIPV